MKGASHLALPSLHAALSFAPDSAAYTHTDAYLVCGITLIHLRVSEQNPKSVFICLTHPGPGLSRHRWDNPGTELYGK